MTAVLGIDAAWTATQPSGVALVKKKDATWRLIATAASYLNFVDGSERPISEQRRPVPSVMNLGAMLDVAASMIGGGVDLIAVDMPLARTAIIARRNADDAVSRAYGARKCGTHTPSAIRPGPISDAMRAACETSGYPLLTQGISTPGLIEVYPHPALLVELTGAIERLPYKISKTKSYWRSETLMNRRTRLLDQWAAIVDALEVEIAGVSAMLPIPQQVAATWELKAFEDALDAVICAWVGICALEERAIPYGDDASAIWIPCRKKMWDDPAQKRTRRKI